MQTQNSIKIAISSGLVSLFLTSCVSYTNQQKFANYSYKGVQYDVYYVKEERNDPFTTIDDGTRLVLVKKGDSPPSSSANVLADCNYTGSRNDPAPTQSQLNRIVKSCEKKFGTALERRLYQPQMDSDSSY